MFYWKVGHKSSLWLVTIRHIYVTFDGSLIFWYCGFEVLNNETSRHSYVWYNATISKQNVAVQIIMEFLEIDFLHLQRGFDYTPLEIDIYIFSSY